MRTPQILTSLKTYSVDLFRADLIAGVTVALVALPLSIAIAIASGASPADGLVTAIVGGFFISLFGGSRVQIGGPTGAFIVVVFSVIAQHGYDGLVLATLMAGVLLFFAGFVRAGRLIAYIPESVVHGFTIGIAIIIAASQLKDALGLHLEASHADVLHILGDVAGALGSANPAAIGVTLLTLAAIILLRRFAPKWPGLIVAIAVGSALPFLLGLPVDTLYSRFGALPNHLPVPHLPDISLARMQELLPSAFIIAFLAGVESLLSAMVADRMIADKHRPNAELTAQGIANIGSALMAGLPATGAIARTATNVRAGGQTPVAGIVHALTILVLMGFAAPLVGYMAMPTLAALLMLTAWNMAEPHHWMSYLRSRPSDVVLLLTTLVLTVLVDLTVAIGVGVGLGLALRLARRPEIKSDWHTPDR